MWRFDVGDPSTSNWTGKILFKSNPGNDSSTGRKIFYPPDVTFENSYQFLFFGTGDREHPVSSMTIVDRLYAVKDYSVSGFTTEGTSEGSCPTSATPASASNQLTDVTCDDLQTGNSVQASAMSAALSTSGGWYIRLTNTGEKDLSPATVINQVATLTTFAPLSSSSAKTCTANLGTAYVYSLSYTNGNSVFNYNQDNSTTAADRSTKIGTDGIPSGVVVTIVPGKTTGLVGIGGGIINVQVPNASSANQIYWHEPYY